LAISAAARSVAVRACEGEPVPGLAMTHKVDGARLGGHLLVMEGVIPPGVLVHPHTHTREDECSYVAEGELVFLVGGEVVQVSAGDMVPKPRGVMHAFWNASERPARVIEMHAPATFDRYYDELGAMFGQHPPGSDGFTAAFDELACRYGLITHWDDMPDLVARFGLGQVPR